MEEKIKLNHPELVHKHETHIKVKPEKEVERKKLQILDSIPKEIIEKLNPEERKLLFESINPKLSERKESSLKNDKLDVESHPHQNHPQPNPEQPHHPRLDHLDDIKEIELMIQLCGNKQELIRLLNDINRILLENSKDHYHINLKKRK